MFYKRLHNAKQENKSNQRISNTRISDLEQNSNGVVKKKNRNSHRCLESNSNLLYGCLQENLKEPENNILFKNRKSGVHKISYFVFV